MRVLDGETARDRQVLLYVDRQVLNEYTSPQAFAALHAAGRGVWRPKASVAVVDHVNSTAPERNARTMKLADACRALQVDTLTANCRRHGIDLFDMLDSRQGIEHVVASEQGLVLPGMVVAAGDSPTTTHGAMGTLGFGIGSSEIEHLRATQTLVYGAMRSMRVSVRGRLGAGITAKDRVLALIRQIGADGASGHVIELTGQAFGARRRRRSTLYSMSVEETARGAIVAPDDRLSDYLHGRLRGRRVAPGMRAMVVPGSTTVRMHAEEDGTARVFLDAAIQPCPSRPSRDAGFEGR